MLLDQLLDKLLDQLLDTLLDKLLDQLLDKLLDKLYNKLLDKPVTHRSISTGPFCLGVLLMTHPSSWFCSSLHAIFVGTYVSVANTDWVHFIA